MVYWVWGLVVVWGWGLYCLVWLYLLYLFKSVWNVWWRTWDLSSYLSKSSSWAYLTRPSFMPTLNLLTLVIGLPSLSKLSFRLFFIICILLCFLELVFLTSFCFFFSALTSNLDLFSTLSLGAFFVDVSMFTLDVFVNGLPLLSTLILFFLLLEYL